jgi:mono/diheme cytochrome c family protein
VLSLLLLIVYAAVAAAAPGEQNLTQGEQIFTQRCAACHTIGGGNLVGPDLKGVAQRRSPQWLVGFVTAPDKVIASGDPTATQMVQQFGTQMPNLGLSSTQAADVLAYVEGRSNAAPASGSQAPAAAPAPPPGDAAAGRAFFLGERRFANGGPACLGCHSAATGTALGGGGWGFDLAQTPSTSNALAAAAIIQAPPYPGMREAFANRPLHADEAADVAAFLASTHANPQGAGTTAAGPAPVPPLFLALGLAVTATLYALAQLAWRRRLGGVRKPLLGGRPR